jgi:hypothetical protein
LNIFRRAFVRGGLLHGISVRRGRLQIRKLRLHAGDGCGLEPTSTPVEVSLVFHCKWLGLFSATIVQLLLEHGAGDGEEKYDEEEDWQEEEEEEEEEEGTRSHYTLL